MNEKTSNVWEEHWQLHLQTFYDCSFFLFFRQRNHLERGEMICVIVKHDIRTWSIVIYLLNFTVKHLLGETKTSWLICVPAINLAPRYNDIRVSSSRLFRISYQTFNIPSHLASFIIFGWEKKWNHFWRKYFGVFVHIWHKLSLLLRHREQLHLTFSLP